MKTITARLLALTLFLLGSIHQLSAEQSFYYRVINDYGRPFEGQLEFTYTEVDLEGDDPNYDTNQTFDLTVPSRSQSGIERFDAINPAGDILVRFYAENITATKVGTSFLLDESTGVSVVQEFNIPSGWYLGHSTALNPYIIVIGVDPPRAPQPDYPKTLWILDDEELTAGLFREGVDKLIAQNSGQETASPMTYAQFLESDTENVATLMLQIGTENPDHSEMEIARNAARAAAEASVTTAVPTLGAKTEVTSPGSSILTFTIPHVGPISLDPGENETIRIFCDYVKLITGWALLAAFAWWTWAEFSGLVGSTVTAQQAKGNPLLGGTGAQATALIAAGILALIFVGIPAAFWAYVTTDVTSLDENPFSSSSGPVQTALYLLALVFPYQLALTLLASAFIIRKAKVVMILGVNAAIKFVVP